MQYILIINYLILTFTVDLCILQIISKVVINHKSKLMKTAAYITGVIGVLLFFLSILLFKLYHLAGAGSLIAYGLLFNAIIAIPIVSIYLYRLNSPDRNLQLFGMASFFILFLGAFLKINHLAGAIEISIVGAFTFCLFIILYAVALYKRV